MTILPILARRYDLRVVDPYGNTEFESLLSEVGIKVSKVSDLSDQNSISTNHGVRRLVDFLFALPKYVCSALVLHRYFVRECIDIVYTNQTKSAVIALLATPATVGVIYHCHDATATGIRTLAKLNHRIDRVIANSSFTGRELIRLGFPKNRVVVVTNAISVDEIQAKGSRLPNNPLPTCQSPPVLLLAHTEMDPNKGTILALEAMVALAAQAAPGELWIAGDVSPAHASYAQKVQSMAAQQGLAGRVHFLGRRSDIYAVMARADIVLVPTMYKEHFGRVAVEAMALGKAVVVSNVGALPSLVEDKVTGRVFDINAPESLTAILRELIQYPDLRSAYGLSGTRYVRERLKVEEFESSILKVFSETLSRSKYRSTHAVTHSSEE